MITNDATNINTLGLIFILIGGILVLMANRKYATVAVLASACFITYGQQVIVFGLHFTALRLIILFGLLRIILKRELRGVKLNRVDGSLFAWAFYSAFANMLLWQTSEAVINRLGFLYNVLGLYFIFRVFIRNFQDMETTIKILTILVIFLAVIIGIESFTGKNLFSAFGGVPELTVMRNGKLRCQGPFRHPIMAGTFGATQAIVIASLWFCSGKKKLLALIGVIAAAVIVLAAGSSGGALTLLVGLAGMCMWIFRKKMRFLRWALLIGILALHLSMHAPVWYLFARLSNVFGGTGWHRAYLIDQAISHFDEWWLIGTKNTAHWMPYSLAGGEADITNQYLQEGVDGGLISAILFISIIVVCFKAIGDQNRRNEDKVPSQFRMVIWLLGVSLFQHTTAFLSVPYFDQMIVFWYLLLAFIATVKSRPSLQPTPFLDTVRILSLQRGYKGG